MIAQPSHGLHEEVTQSHALNSNINESQSSISRLVFIDQNH